jgi:metal-sulfur cluster biosynthetic enzyme
MTMWDRVNQWLGGEPEAEVTVVRDAEGEAGRALDAVRGVLDPEVGMDVVSLGLIRGIAVADGRCLVRMTVTTAGCPMTDHLVQAVSEAIEGVGLEATVELELEPPWRPDHIDPGPARPLG